MSWLPAGLLAPARLPLETWLPRRYVAQYYGTSKAGWKAYQKSPISSSLRWHEASKWNDLFPKPELGWADPSDDRSFVQLRLQGPNPFLLKRVDHDGHFELDFSKLFTGIVKHPPTARFVVDHESELGLRAVSIRIGDNTYTPRSPETPEQLGWEKAKRIVNALDARYSAFVRHLLNTHLMVGQAFGLSALYLPVWHPLRPFMDFFTYGSLQVNHYAYDSLLTPTSYFIASNFITEDTARRLIENAMDEFDFNSWIVPHDLDERGIRDIPNHPYVQDAEEIWPLLKTMVRRYLNDVEIHDDDIADDPHLMTWYSTLRQVLPDPNMAMHLTTRAQLEDVLTAAIYNNVIHEVCGNLSPILGSRDPDDKRTINLNHLIQMMDPKADTPEPLAAEVLLMDQASYVSTFNVAGNNLLEIEAARFIDDPRFIEAVEELQDTLSILDKTIRARNDKREIPFFGMQPSLWEASISF